MNEKIFGMNFSHLLETHNIYSIDNCRPMHTVPHHITGLCTATTTYNKPFLSLFLSLFHDDCYSDSLYDGFAAARACAQLHLPWLLRLISIISHDANKIIIFYFFLILADGSPMRLLLFFFLITESHSFRSSERSQITFLAQIPTFVLGNFDVPVLYCAGGDNNDDEQQSINSINYYFMITAQKYTHTHTQAMQSLFVFKVCEHRFCWQYDQRITLARVQWRWIN